MWKNAETKLDTDRKLPSSLPSKPRDVYNTAGRSRVA